MRSYFDLVNTIYMKVFNANSDARDRSIRIQTEDKNNATAESKKIISIKLKTII